MANNYLGYRVKIFMRDSGTIEGTISYVDQSILKLSDVQRSDRKDVKELIVKASDMVDLEVIGKAMEEVVPRSDDIQQRNGSQPSHLRASADSIPIPKKNSPSIAIQDPAIISMNVLPPPMPTQLYDSSIPFGSTPPSQLVQSPSSYGSQQIAQNSENGNKGKQQRDRYKSPGRRGNVSPKKSEKESRYAKKDNTTFEPISREARVPDFDFEASNARFNKSQIFGEMLSNASSSPPLTETLPSSIPTIQFYSDSEVEMPAVTAFQMEKVFKSAEELGLSFEQMVENAGRSLAQVALKLLKNDSMKVIVLAGTGKNGAGGVCAARHLANHDINVFVCRSRAYQLSEELSRQWAIYRASGGKEAQVGSLPVEPVGLIVDALIGTRLNGPVRDPTATLIGWANANGANILSYDVPSGVDASTGRTEGAYIHASTTLTVALPKTGLLKSKTGSLYVADAGIPSSIFTKIGLDYSSPFSEHFIQKLQQS